MAGQNDFLIFDENSENILSQALYASDEDRTDGFKTGLARSNVNNKVLRQTSIMATAIGEIVKKQGGQATDSSLANLVGSIERVYGIKKYYYDATFAIDEVVLAIVDDSVEFYKSLVNNNTGNALTDTTKWDKVELGGGSSRNIGEIVASTIPLTDAGLHLLDGALIQGSGSYSAFVDYIAELYDSGDYDDIFETEANWQSAVTTYGVCGKFVYDSVNNTVRLPKYNDKIYTSSISNNAPVKGNGMSLGLTDGTNNFGLYGAGAQDLRASIGNYGKNIGVGTTGTNAQSDKTIGLTTNGTKSGIIADLSNITTSLKGYYYIVVATTTKTDIQVDIDEIATDLNGKMDVDMSNMNASSSAKNTIINWGMPDYSAVVTLAKQNGTVSSDGYLIITSNTNGNAYITIEGVTFSLSSAYYNFDEEMLPISKNNAYSSTTWGNVDYIKFIPLKGVS